MNAQQLLKFLRVIFGWPEEEHSEAISNELKTFLHWVRSKKRIVNKLIEHLPSGPYYNYYEPFLGGGALFFQVRHLFKQCFLSDINLDLITSYHAVKRIQMKSIDY
ncbi:D12 class N6 adenine-specific DNA methyltransferase family protein [Orientia tsutsugamushi str. TA763]|nr:D12 class N6 adenine-specific DNA methyltransferase family protein [Orientia tsutsugamushi str. TA763]